MGNRPTIAVSHLGCEKNRIDTEHMLGLLVQAGYEVDADEALADYVIVNTCSFIQAAREESVRTLVELAEANKKIVITGCMAQHFQAELLEELPEAVAIVGTGDYHKIVDVVERAEAGERVHEVSANPTYIADETVPRYRTTTEGVAYVRVAEGCDYRCAFCIIPHLRGNQRSRTIESIVAEVVWRTPLGGVDSGFGQSRYCLGPNALRLPHGADPESYCGHPKYAQLHPVLGSAPTALPSSGFAIDESPLAGTGQRQHHGQAEGSDPPCRVADDLYRWVPR
jgi:hypothetical protein